MDIGECEEQLVVRSETTFTGQKNDGKRVASLTSLSKILTGLEDASRQPRSVFKVFNLKHMNGV